MPMLSRCAQAWHGPTRSTSLTRSSQGSRDRHEPRALGYGWPKAQQRRQCYLWSGVQHAGRVRSTRFMMGTPGLAWHLPDSAQAASLSLPCAGSFLGASRCGTAPQQTLTACRSTCVVLAFSTTVAAAVRRPKHRQFSRPGHGLRGHRESLRVVLERPDLISRRHPVAHAGMKASVGQLLGTAQENPSLVPELGSVASES